jgi:hypothetical protein
VQPLSLARRAESAGEWLERCFYSCAESAESPRPDGSRKGVPIAPSTMCSMLNQHLFFVLLTFDSNAAHLQMSIAPAPRPRSFERDLHRPVKPILPARLSIALSGPGVRSRPGKAACFFGPVRGPPPAPASARAPAARGGARPADRGRSETEERSALSVYLYLFFAVV